MTSKDKTVKAKTDIRGWTTCGRIYKADYENNDYVIVNDSGYTVPVHESHFDEVPEIKVGDTWLTFKGGEVDINYVGKEWITYTLPSGGEFSTYRSKFLSTFVPKPKTVKMYFYRVGDRYIAYSYKQTACAFDFTREIELP